MFRYLVSALLCYSSLGLFQAAIGPSSADISGWWTRATNSFSAASDYVATRTVLRIEELDKDGRVKSTEQGETRIELNGTKPVVVVVKAEKNGKDASDEWRKRYEKQSRSSSDGESSRAGPPGGFDATPFDPKYAKDLKLGEPKAGSGGLTIPYSIATTGGDIEGTVNFSSSGTPIEAIQTWVNPRLFVSSMNSSVRYTQLEGALVISGMNIEGEASILFIKYRFRMSFEFLEWQRVAQ